MNVDVLRRNLQRTGGSRVPSRQFAEQLELDLLERYLHQKRSRRSRRKRFQRVYASLTAVIFLLAAVGILGFIPTSYEVPVGYTLQAEVNVPSREVPALAEILALFEGTADDASVSISHSADQQMTLLVILFEPRRGPEEVIDLLHGSYPVFKEAPIKITKLVGSIQRSLLGSFAHQKFSIDIGGGTLAKARRDFVRELSLHGFAEADIVVGEEYSQIILEIRAD